MPGPFCSQAFVLFTQALSPGSLCDPLTLLWVSALLPKVGLPTRGTWGRPAPDFFMGVRKENSEEGKKNKENVIPEMIGTLQLGDRRLASCNVVTSTTAIAAPAGGPAPPSRSRDRGASPWELRPRGQGQAQGPPGGGEQNENSRPPLCKTKARGLPAMPCHQHQSAGESTVAAACPLQPQAPDEGHALHGLRCSSASQHVHVLSIWTQALRRARCAHAYQGRGVTRPH